MSDVLKKIEESVPSFSKGQKKIAQYIINQYNKAVFMTAAKIAEETGVSESTVVRFADAMGYDGFPEFQQALQDSVKGKLTALQRFEQASEHLESRDMLSLVMNSDISRLKATYEQLDKELFEKAVQSISKAKKIYIIGVRSSSALASFLGFYLNLLFDDVRVISTTSVSEVFEQIMRIGKDDVLIGISFPRYSNRTVKALQYAKTNGATVISVTDSKVSPLVEYSDVALLAESGMVSFVDSLVAPLSIINALIVSLGMNKKSEIKDTFDRLEDIWKEYNVYK
ncbi:MAG: MurR/RpiR family transcriptional regulator [Clostridia bacterium]|nr:MurR/RpiR family transcriptional regulator [Clostridia bacterium]